MCLFSLASQRKKYTWMISQRSTKGKSKKLVPRFLSFKKPNILFASRYFSYIKGLNIETKHIEKQLLPKSERITEIDTI